MWGRAFLVAALVSGCAGSSSESAVEGDEDAPTSLPARQRILTFQGLVYVDPAAKDETILDAARAQARSAFGALLAQEVAVQSRELQNVDPASFVKKTVKVGDKP